MENLRIIPIRLGIVTRTKSNFNLKDTHLKIDAPIIMWYIEGADKKIIVDTGGSDPNTELAQKYHAPYVRSEDEAPVRALAKLGVAPEEIDIVINTHLHWDHCYGNEFFKKAKCIVQKKEFEFAVNPIPTQDHAYEALTGGIIPPWMKITNWEVINGDEKLTDGVNLILTPGHTKGTQSVVVKTKKGPIIIAGDTVVLFENWKGRKSVPNGIHVDLQEYYETFKKLESYEPVIILPGHDPKVFDQQVYPN